MSNNDLLSADEIGVPILHALGLPVDGGVISATLTIRAGEFPVLTLERHVRNAGGMYVTSGADPKKLESELTRYELRLKKEVV